MFYSLSQAAKATGKGKSTIHRALINGTISGIRKGGEGIGGSWEIDAAELHRVFPREEQSVPEPAEPVPPNGVWDKPEPLELLREQVAHRDEVIADLRARLDRSEEERRQAQTQLMALLSPPTAARRRWWWRRG